MRPPEARPGRIGASADRPRDRPPRHLARTGRSGTHRGTAGTGTSPPPPPAACSAPPRHDRRQEVPVQVDVILQRRRDQERRPVRHIPLIQPGVQVISHASGIRDAGQKLRQARYPAPGACRHGRWRRGRHRARKYPPSWTSRGFSGLASWRAQMESLCAATSTRSAVVLRSGQGPGCDLGRPGRAAMTRPGPLAALVTTAGGLCCSVALATRYGPEPRARATARQWRRHQTRRRTRRGSARSGCSGTRRGNAGRWRAAG
jgi:hypothetical protein